MTSVWMLSVIILSCTWLIFCESADAAFVQLKNGALRATLASSTDSESQSTRLFVARPSSTTNSLTNRREFLSLATLIPVSIGLTTGLLSETRAVVARDEIFRSNPLTGPFLEKVRILDQEVADDLKYGGELERGDAGNKGKTEAYPKLLLPILVMANELDAVDRLVREGPDSWKDAEKILDKPSYEKIQFKKIFNAFGDNIYYSDPDRANLYLGGGATPMNEQTIAYLLRNEMLTNVEALQAEIKYLLQHPEEDSADLYKYSRAAKTSMQGYLDIVPPDILSKARSLSNSS